MSTTQGSVTSLPAATVTFGMTSANWGSGPLGGGPARKENKYIDRFCMFTICFN